MLGLNEPSARPTLNQIGQNLSNENLSFEETIKKTTYEFKIILLGSIAVGKTSILTKKCRFYNREDWLWKTQKLHK